MCNLFKGLMIFVSVCMLSCEDFGLNHANENNLPAKKVSVLADTWESHYTQFMVDHEGDTDTLNVVFQISFLADSLKYSNRVTLGASRLSDTTIIEAVTTSFTPLTDSTFLWGANKQKYIRVGDDTLVFVTFGFKDRIDTLIRVVSK